MVIIFGTGIAIAKADLLEIYKEDPGFVDFGVLRELENDGAVTEVIIRHHLLEMVAKMSKTEKPEFASLLEQLRLIYVHVFQLEDNNKAQSYETIKQLNHKLQDEGWESIVRMREDKEEVTIYILPDDEGIQGLCILNIDDDEVSLINIVGTIDLKMMTQLGVEFDIPVLGGMSGENQLAE